MNFFSIFIFVISFNHVALASWFGIKIWSDHKDTSVTPHDQEIIEHGKAMIMSYEKKDECFKNAALNVRADCVKLDNLEKVKINLAIQFTLCQLKLAGFQPPSICYEIDNDEFNCVAELGKITQYWVTYTSFYLETSTMCFTTNYEVKQALLSEFRKNITITYDNIIQNISQLIENFRKEELERLPRITSNLNKLINDVITLQNNTNLVSEEIIFVKKSLSKFQDNIIESLNHTIILDEKVKSIVPYVDNILKDIELKKMNKLKNFNEILTASENLSNQNLHLAEEINEKLSNVITMAQDSLNMQSKLNTHIEKSKKEVESFTDEISNHVKNLSFIFKTINVIIEIVGKKWLFITPLMILKKCGIKTGISALIVITTVIIILFYFYDETIFSIFSYEFSSYIAAIIVGMILSDLQNYYFASKNKQK